jgi:hypothetical protein
MKGMRQALVMASMVAGLGACGLSDIYSDREPGRADTGPRSLDAGPVLHDGGPSLRDAGPGARDTGPPAFSAADAGASCAAMADAWRKAVDGLDRSCATKSDCAAPGDRATCNCDVLLGWHAPAVNVKAYQDSNLFMSLEWSYYADCSSFAGRICDVGPVILDCVAGTCEKQGRGCCMWCPGPDAGG